MTFDAAFAADEEGLQLALSALSRTELGRPSDLPVDLPEQGRGEFRTLEELAPHVLGRATRLDAADSLAHMDPPTPWITWALSLWNARLNQNVLHAATGPFAREAEQRVVGWLAPFFAMTGGHMTPGSSLANLTALWAAREVAHVKRVVTSKAAHLSIRKAAHLLGLDLVTVPTDPLERLSDENLGDLSDACLVLTAGTTAAGAIDPLALAGHAAWTHVDAAWAGPLRLSEMYRTLLDGIERADSVAVSAHKWLFQPKELALVFFRDVERANEAISFEGGYLTVPNIGVLGSHGAMAVPLLGTLLAWGREGVANRIELCQSNAHHLAEVIGASSRFELFTPPETGVVVFRPTTENISLLAARLGPLSASTTRIKDRQWLRCVSANPIAVVERVLAKLGLMYSAN